MVIKCTDCEYVANCQLRKLAQNLTACEGPSVLRTDVNTAERLEDPEWEKKSSQQGKIS